jgi:hypothetical protein
MVVSRFAVLYRIYIGHKKRYVFRELNLQFQWPVIQILFGKRTNEFVLNFDHESLETAYDSDMWKERISVPVHHTEAFL